jgi:hypothetical protein
LILQMVSHVYRTTQCLYSAIYFQKVKLMWITEAHLNKFLYVRLEVSDYEECRLLGYKNPVRTSQETYYVSTTESSHLMLRKI